MWLENYFQKHALMHNAIYDQIVMSHTKGWNIEIKKENTRLFKIEEQWLIKRSKLEKEKGWQNRNWTKWNIETVFCQTCEQLTVVINLLLSNGFPSMLVSSKDICIRHYAIGMLMKWNLSNWLSSYYFFSLFWKTVSCPRQITSIK